MKPILVQLGHVGIGVSGKSYHLIPSLAAMSKLTNPVQMYHQLHQGDIDTAYEVIEACSDHDISEHLGQAYMPAIKVGDKIKPVAAYSKDTIPDDKALIIAVTLLYHGIIGDFKPRKTEANKKENYSETFDAMEFASIAMVHLGLSQDEAWSLTMTQLRRALAIKFPPSEKEKAQDELLAEYDEMLEWRKSLYGNQNVTA